MLYLLLILVFNYINLKSSYIFIDSFICLNYLYQILVTSTNQSLHLFSLLNLLMKLN
jgi:hypothetical protein